MQSAVQSYGMQIYSQVQRGASPLPAGKSNETSTHPKSSDESHSNSYQDTLSLSPAGKEIASQQKVSAVTREKGTDQKPLTDEELVKLTQLKQRDREVRTHEQAHLSAAGAYAAGGASFSFTTGPNGQRYATAGSVPIDTSKEDSPAATILKMQTVRRAALAPANPSSADRAIAAQASAKQIQAQKELQAEQNSATPPAPAQGEKTDSTAVKQEQQPPPEGSDYSRRTMTLAYKAMATLAN